jgi:tRNA (guanine37-N1)-methyltransferase
MRIDLFTIFPTEADAWLQTGLVGRARSESLADLRVHDLRAGADDQRRTIDDEPFGGGAGMVLAPQPVFRAVEAADPPRPLFCLSASGRQFDQQMAIELAGSDGFSLLAGRYEGIDQRVVDHLCDEEISVGDYVLVGGEVAAFAVVEATLRLVPGVLGNPASPEEESFSEGLLEYPQYTRPADFRGYSVPEVLRSGDHGKIAAWRRAAALARTIERRPDLIEARGGLRPDEVKLLAEHGYS